VQNPLRLDTHNLFMPDVMLLRNSPDFYRSRYPAPDDVLLCAEVAQSSLFRDRRIKLPRYARFGVPRVWIIDMGHRCVHAHEDLRDDGYRAIRRCSGKTELSIPEDGGITVDELIG